ncbi:hypothetical protein GKC34_06490, partial [Lactobacillus salivarius]|nr:hypothetical protein [Ligilactobacillus salivarius]
MYGSTYYRQSPKFTPQTNFRDLPESYYITLLLQSATNYSPNGERAINNKPNSIFEMFANPFDNLESEYNDYLDLLDDASHDDEPANFDRRLTKGEVKAVLKKLLGIGDNTIVDGEVIKLSPTELEAAKKKLGSDSLDIDGTNRKAGRVALGFEYAMDHYSQGYPLANISNMDAYSKIWGNTTKADNRTPYLHAFSRLFIAYAEAAKEKGLLKSVKKDTDNTMVTVVQEDQKDGKWNYTLKVTGIPEQSQAVTLQTTAELAKVVRPTNAEAVGDWNLINVVLLPVDAAKDGITLEADHQLSDEELQSLNVSINYTTSIQGQILVPRSMYRKDNKTGHWIVREYVIANHSTSGFNETGGVEPRHGMELGQNVMMMSPNPVLVTARVRIQRDLPTDWSVTFSKQDIAGKEIAGAKIQISDKDGKVVDSWTSEADKSHTTSLKPGTYTFHEISAPEGYEVVTDFTFTVEANGEVTVGESKDAKVEAGKLIVTDQVKPVVPETKEVVISKQDIAGKEIAGAKIQISDKDGKVV